MHVIISAIHQLIVYLGKNDSDGAMQVYIYHKTLFL